jgi:hypothetical protein
MTTNQKNKNASANVVTEAPTPEGKERRERNNQDYTVLEWFFQQGARFVRVAAWNAKVNSPGKQPTEKSWQGKPLTLREVLQHVKSGGNVGLLCGKHSSGLCLLDVDDHLHDFLEYFPGLKDAPIIQRKDAANRGKIVLRIDGDIPKNQKWHDVHLEFLATGNQGVIPPSIHPSGSPYDLINADKLPLDFDGLRLVKICEAWQAVQAEIKKPTATKRRAGSPTTGRGKPSRQTKDFLEFGAGEGTRNNRLFNAACDLNGCGYPESDAEFMLMPVGMRIGMSEKEIRTTIRSAYKQTRQPANPHAFGNESQGEGGRSTAPLDFLGDDIPAGDASDPLQVKRYEVINGAYHAIEYKENRGAEPITVTRALCNFDARILEEIAKDDGQEITRVLKIKGQLPGGSRLTEIEVDASEFSGMKWVMQKWGLKAIIHAGQSNADKLREAIQWHSQGAISRTEYTHTGWREIDGKRVYLTTSGAIGLDNVTVRLEGNLKRYAIPTDLDGLNLQEAVKKSLQLLDLAPRSVTWALWGSMYLAPLADLAPIDFVLWIFAETGSLKSTLCALFLCHYGNFTYKTLPEGWASTDNALEKSIFATKDAPIVIDDFAPQASGMEAQNYERRANRIIRAIGNHSPRTRMNADTSLREGYPSRGLVISTAEQLPSGQSILARCLPVEILRDSVNKDLLTKAQQEAEYLPQAMAGYLTWLSKNWESIKADFQNRITILRDEMRGDYHLRTPEMFANLLLGVRLGLTFATESGAITKADAKALFANAKTEIKNLAESQSEHVRDELPTNRFINVLEALIAQSDFYLTDAAGTADTSGKTWLGWFDRDYVYIQSDTSYNAVSEFLRREGAPPLLKQKSLYAMFVRQEFILPTDKKNTSSERYKSKTFRVLRFYRNKVNFTANPAAES